MGNLLLTIKRTYFWVLCPLVVILAGVFWMMGISGLKKQKDSSLQEINQLFTSVDGVKNKPEYANSNVQEGMEKLIAKRRSEVAEAWTRKYEQQTAEKIGILKWPDITEFPERDRSDAAKLLAIVKELRPIEKKVGLKLTAEQKLVLTQKQIYEEFIRGKLPELAEAIGAQWQVAVDPNAANPSYGAGPQVGGEFNRGAMATDASGMPLPEDAIVYWNPANQQEIFQYHFTWGVDTPSFGSNAGGFREGSRMPGPPGGGFGNTAAPSGPRPPDLLEILYAQEDFWVLKALMEVIARSNKGATGRFNAAVKEIEFIRFGKAANHSAGMVDSPAAAMDATSEAESAVGSEGGGPGPGGPQSGPPDSYAQGGRREMGGEPGASEEPGVGMGGPPDPADGRYVDSSYKKLDPAILRKVMTTPAEAAPEEHYLAVAKRIPVRMRVKIDQRKLYNFLLECANSELTLEVRQLRVNPSDDMGMPGMSGTMMSQGYSPSPIGIGPGPSREGEFRGRPGPPGSNVGFGDSMGTSMSAVDQHSRTDVTVEVYGIIYIYNPVDKVILKEPEAGSETPADSDAVAKT